LIKAANLAPELARMATLMAGGRAIHSDREDSMILAPELARMATLMRV